MAVSGPGHERAAAAAERLLGARCGALLSFGVAAGIIPSLRPGDIVIADSVHCIDEGASIPADATWRDALVERSAVLGNVRVGTVVGLREVVATPADKRAIAPFGIVADMETGAVAEVARARGVRWLAVRAVVDPAAARVPEAALAGMRADGASARLALARALLARPADLPAVVGLGLRFARARLALRAFVRRAGPSFCLPAGSR